MCCVICILQFYEHLNVLRLEYRDRIKHRLQKGIFWKKKNINLENLNHNYYPLSISSMLQASRGTVKASGNFSASADAEVLHKAMKGLGKMLTHAELLAQCYLIQQRHAS